MSDQMPNPANGTPAFVTITNKDIWLKLSFIEKALSDNASFGKIQIDINEDFKKRVRALELRFYGILAGLIGATATFVALLTRGGGA